MEQENQNFYGVNNIPEEYQPLSMGKFLGFQLLFAIPCVGFILTIVFACGAIKNKNLINWARAQLILVSIVFIVYIVLLVFGVGLAIFDSATAIY